MLEPVSSLLPDRLNRLKVKKPIDPDAVCAAADQALTAVWQGAAPMRATDFRDGRLTVAVTSSSWSHQISARAERLKELANKRLKRKTIRTIRTKVSPRAAETTDA
jgi:Dna[CI] antecedent DciA-like protein